MEEKQSKALPFEVKKGFTGVPNVINTVYVNYPGFDVYAISIYGHLLQRYNPDYGYAFPTVPDIAFAVNCGDRKVKSTIKLLKEVGLINVTRSTVGKNNVYTFNAPYESVECFEEKFPQVKFHRLAREKVLLEKKTASVEDKKRLVGADTEDVVDYF